MQPAHRISGQRANPYESPKSSSKGRGFSLSTVTWLLIVCLVVDLFCVQVAWRDREYGFLYHVNHRALPYQLVSVIPALIAYALRDFFDCDWLLYVNSDYVSGDWIFNFWLAKTLATLGLLGACWLRAFVKRQRACRQHLE